MSSTLYLLTLAYSLLRLIDALYSLHIIGVTDRGYSMILNIGDIVYGLKGVELPLHCLVVHPSADSLLVAHAHHICFILYSSQ